MGIEDASNQTVYTRIPYFDDHGLSVQQVACCRTYSTFLCSGDVYVCGYSATGGLGAGPKVTQYTSFQKVLGLSGLRIVQISCGFEFTIARDEDGQLWSWGGNTYGQVECAYLIEERVSIRARVMETE